VPAVPPPPASCGTTIPYINKNHLTSELPVEQQESFGSHSDFTPANNNIDTVASPAYAIAVPGSVDSGGDYSWSNLKDGPLSEQLSQMSSRQQSYNSQVSQMSSGQQSYNSMSYYSANELDDFPVDLATSDELNHHDDTIEFNSGLILSPAFNEQTCEVQVENSHQQIVTHYTTQTPQIHDAN
jgi:hypothetical protein